MEFLNHVELLKDFTIEYGLPLPQYTVYPDLNSETKSFSLAQFNIFYNNDDKKMQKTKIECVQIDPRPKLLLWEISCRICNTQMHSTKECCRRNILKVDKSTQFPPALPPRDSSTFSRLFFPFLQKTPTPKSNHM